MSRIDNPNQLRQLQLKYAQVEGAQAAAQAAAAAAQAAGQSYLELLQALAGITIPSDTGIRVDFETGEVQLETHDSHTNGVIEGSHAG